MGNGSPELQPPAHSPQLTSLGSANFGSFAQTQSTRDRTVFWDGTLTNFTVLPGIALITTTAVHGAVGSTGAPVQARVVLTGICGVYRMDRQCEDGLATMSWNPEISPLLTHQ